MTDYDNIPCCESQPDYEREYNNMKQELARAQYIIAQKDIQMEILTEAIQKMREELRRVNNG